MEGINLIINILILFIIGILLLIAKSYLPSYLKEKGRNLATKEDIEKITDKIEKIRTQYQTSLEKLKAEIQVAANQLTVFRERANESLLKFFDDCLELLSDKLSTNLGDLPIDQGKSLWEFQVSMYKLFTKIFSDYHRLLLYFSSDNQIILAAGDLIKSAIEIRLVFRRHFSKMKIALIEEGEAPMSGEKIVYHERVEKSNEIAKEYNREMNPAIEAMRSAFNNYLSALNNYFKESLGIETVFESFQ